MRARLQLSDSALMREMRVITAGGEVLGGADAVVRLCEELPLGRALALLARIPGVMFLLRAGYRFIARNRGCIGGVCKLP